MLRLEVLPAIPLAEEPLQRVVAYSTAAPGRAYARLFKCVRCHAAETGIHSAGAPEANVG